MSEPEQDAGKFREWFAFQPETIIEAAEYLQEHGGPYEQYLASELAEAYENTPADLSDYGDISVIEDP